MLYAHPSKSHGAFLIIALILLIVLSALGVASMTLALTSNRVSQNYSGYLEAKTKAESMVQYGMRILSSHTPYTYPLPDTCDSAVTCNVINNNYPYSGRPTLAWTANLDTDKLVKTAGSDNWWTTNGFAYEGTYSGSGNARVIVSQVGSDTDYPWMHTYKIVGYGTDNTGKIRATASGFISIAGYPPDPYPSTVGTSMYSTSACTGGCAHGQCCSSSVCSTSQASCESATQTFTPPGWYCDEYFVTGLGYGASSCTNNTAYVLNAFNMLLGAVEDGYENYKATGSFPDSIVINSTTIPHTTWVTLNYQSVSDMAYERNSTGMMAHARIPNVSNKVLSIAIRDMGNGDMKYVCGYYSSSSYPTEPLPASELPPECTCFEVNTFYVNGTGC